MSHSEVHFYALKLGILKTIFPLLNLKKLFTYFKLQIFSSSLQSGGGVFSFYSEKLRLLLDPSYCLASLKNCHKICCCIKRSNVLVTTVNKICGNIYRHHCSQRGLVIEEKVSKLSEYENDPTLIQWRQKFCEEYCVVLNMHVLLLSFYETL